MKEKEVLAIITYPVFVAAGMICPSADIFEPNSTSRVYRSNEKPPRGLPFMSSLAVGGTLASSDMFRWGEKLEMYRAALYSYYVEIREKWSCFGS